MKNFKTILITILSVLIMIFISCSNDSTNPKVAFKVSDIVGTWSSTSSTDTFTIYNDGAFTLNFGGTSSSSIIENWNGNEQIMEGDYYDMSCLVYLTEGGTGTLYFRFSSGHDCTVTLLKSSGNQQEKFTK